MAAGGEERRVVLVLAVEGHVADVVRLVVLELVRGPVGGGRGLGAGGDVDRGGGAGEGAVAGEDEGGGGREEAEEDDGECEHCGSVWGGDLRRGVSECGCFGKIRGKQENVGEQAPNYQIALVFGPSH